ncbi:MAG: SIMPL domain-containing protein [Maricaulaceae bacterium]
MNRHAVWGSALALTWGLTACQAKTEVAPLNHNDVQAYNSWLAKQDMPEHEGFDAKALGVSAAGKVKAVPDIAVITAQIKAKDLNESKAFNQVSESVTAIDAALRGQAVEINFLGIGSFVNRDEVCQSENALAQTRHSNIQSDYWFNKRLENRGDKDTKRREMKPRLKQAICDITDIQVALNMVVRAPASEAGAVLKTLTDQGADAVQLYGYDFSDYDALYQEAAEKAVTQARMKAELIARAAGTQLGEIKVMSLSAPERQKRYGPQGAIVGGTFGKPTVRHASNFGVLPAVFGTISETVVTQEASTELVTAPATYETVQETIVVQPATVEYITLPNGSVQEHVVPAVTRNQSRRVVNRPSSTQERIIPAVTKQVTRRVVKTPARAMDLSASLEETALNMSLRSGPQTITVTAQMSYDYVTPIDGSIVPKM